MRNHISDAVRRSGRHSPEASSSQMGSRCSSGYAPCMLSSPPLHQSLLLQDFFLLFFTILRTTATRELEDYFPMSSFRFADFISVSGVVTLSVRVFVSCWRHNFAWDPSSWLLWGDKIPTLHLAQYFHDSRKKCFFTQFFFWRYKCIDNHKYKRKSLYLFQFILTNAKLKNVKKGTQNFNCESPSLPTWLTYDGTNHFYTNLFIWAAP